MVFVAPKTVPVVSGFVKKMLAEALGIQQPAIAKMEKRTDPTGGSFA
jgi:hypothetical protein